MSDSISRQAAIDAIEKYLDKFDCIDANFLDGLKTTKKILNDLPSAQLKQRWIPCSERLPEPYEDVLVYYEYFKYDAYSAMSQTHGIGFISAEGTWYGDVYGLNSRCLAWMPLPDAFEEDDDE